MDNMPVVTTKHKCFLDYMYPTKDHANYCEVNCEMCKEIDEKYKPILACIRKNKAKEVIANEND